MNDLDTALLRRALKAAGDTADPVDVTQIMAKGRRLRRRRRLTAVAGGVCAIAMVTGTGTAIAQLTAAPPGRSQPVGPALHRPANDRQPQHGPQSRTPRPEPSPASTRPASPGPTAVSPISAPSATPTRSASTRSTGSTPVPTRSPSASSTPSAVPTRASQPAGTALPTPTGATSRP